MVLTRLKNLKKGPQVIFFCIVLGGLLVSIDIFTKNKIISISQSQDLAKEVNIVPIVIVGGGPAGLSAAIYTARAKIPTVAFDDHAVIKGESSMVENWPGIHPIKRKDLFKTLKEQAERFGALVVYDPIERVDLSRWPFVIHTRSGQILNALTIILATGSRLSHIPIKNESDYWGKGVAPCSYCDAPRAQGKEVLVCGEGAEVLLEAMNIAPYARKITVILNCKPHEVSIDEKQTERLGRYKNMDIRYQTRVEQINGDGKWIREAIIRDQENKEHVMPIDMVFIASSRKGNSDLVSQELGIDKNGYIQTIGRSQQAQDGIFVAGEVQDFIYRQAAVAAGDGIKAAIEAIQFMQSLGIDYGKVRELKDSLYAPLQEKLEKESIQHLESIEQLEKAKAAHFNDMVIVMFHAHGCHYCHEMIPVFEAVASSEKQNGRAFFLADVQTAQDFIPLFNIEEVPLICIFKNGKLLRQKEGVMTEEKLLEFINDDDKRQKTNK